MSRDATYLRWAVRNWASIAGLGLRPGPLAMLRMRRRYPWLSGFLRVNGLMQRLMGGRTGAYRRATGYALHRFTKVFCNVVRDIARRPDRMIWHEDLVSPEIFYAMDLAPFMVEMLGIVLPLVDTALGEKYIDEAEGAGIPPDACTLPRIGMGMALEEQFPPPLAIVASNAPCDAGMTSYALYERLAGVPAFRLDLPYRFRDERAVDYYVGELERMIAFLEEHTPGRMDWDRLREVCRERNRATEVLIELFDLLRARPAPLGADVIFLGNLVFSALVPGTRTATRSWEGILRWARRSMREGGALADEKVRVLLWNPATLVFPELFSWAEQAFGAVMVMDMLTFRRHGLIDTSSPGSMLRGLARDMMQGPMARHTLGPVEYFFEDMFFIQEHFSIDAIWMAAHVGCKNTQALLGMMREKCRARRIPLLAIDYDLGDSRVVSPAGIREQVSRFMECVMNT